MSASRSAGFRSAALRSLLVLLLLPAAWTRGFAQERPTGYEDGIMELAAERLPPVTVVVLVDSAGSVLLPLQHVTYYLGLVTTSANGAISVPRIGDVAARIDTVAGMITLPGAELRPAPAEMVVLAGNVFLRSELVARVLEADIHVDFATLVTRVTRTTLFPAQQRVAAEQRRAFLLARERSAAERAQRYDVPYRASSGAGVLDYQVGTASLDPTELVTARAQLGVAVLGGDLTTGALIDVGSRAVGELRDATVRYHRVFPRNPWVRQFRAGDILTSGLFGRYLRGVELSNRPYLRALERGSIVVAPDLPPGWDYEVFQGNQLLGYSQPGAPDPVTLRLNAGATPVQVRMYGPAGEEVVSSLVYQAPVTLLDAGAVEYAAAGGECSARDCAAFAHADLRYGVSSLFTMGGGFELVDDTAATRFRPYLVSSFTTGTRMTAELTYMPLAHYGAHLELFPRAGSSAQVRGTIARPGFGPLSLSRQDRMRWDVEGAWDQRRPAGSTIGNWRAAVAASGVLGTTERWRALGAAGFGTGYAELRYDRDDTPAGLSTLSSRIHLFSPFPLGRRTLRPLFTGMAGVSRLGMQLAEIGATIQPYNAMSLSGAVQWNRLESRPAFTLGYQARLGGVQAAMRAVSSERGASSALMLSGSVAVTADGSIAALPHARTGYAGLHGVVFVDDDGDGVLSDGDTPVPGAHLIVGGHHVVADANGRFSTWALHPYQSIAVAVDSTSTPDPAWTAATSEIILRPAPNMARRADIPLVRTRELIGAVEGELGTRGGISIDITDLDSGVTLTTVTFSDGQYYVSRMRPGRYRLAVAESSLRALGSVSVPPALEFVIPIAGDDVAVELPAIRIER